MAHPTLLATTVLAVVVLAVFTWLLVKRYARLDTPLICVAVVWLSWFLTFFGTLLLPVDLAITQVPPPAARPATCNHAPHR